LMKWLTVNVHREMHHRMPFKHFFLKLFDQFDYSLSISGGFSAEYLRGLSQVLAANLRLRCLTVNGQELTIPLWRRNVEYWIRRLLLDIVPLLVLFISYIRMPAYFKTNPFLFLAFLCVFPYMARFIGRGLWILIQQWLVPHGYIIKLLLARKTKLNWGDRFWLRLFGGSDIWNEVS
jgi:hypothetical protein